MEELVSGWVGGLVSGGVGEFPQGEWGTRLRVISERHAATCFKKLCETVALPAVADAWATTPLAPLTICQNAERCLRCLSNKTLASGHRPRTPNRGVA